MDFSARGQAIREVIAERFSRRMFLRGAGVGLVAAGSGFVGSFFSGESFAGRTQSTLGFTELKRSYSENAAIAAGYSYHIVARWGDPLVPGIGKFDATDLTPETQAQRFGYNCDFIAFMPLPRGSKSSVHGLLCVNHEYVSPNLMFPGLTERDAGSMMTADQVDICMAATGHSVIEVTFIEGQWRIVEGSPYNRRLTVETDMTLAGPVAGNNLTRTSADPFGRSPKGTSNNCGGGVTPWGTVLICEEGVSNTFGGTPDELVTGRILKRYGYSGADEFGRARFHDRFNVSKEPNEPNRFDWVVEFDPYDPQCVPVKRTALGRMSHEAATLVLNKDGRIVVYMGDDEAFEYIYRFVSSRVFDPSRPETGKDILDEGVLSVAKFNSDGKLVWLPLLFGEGILVAENGFADQAEVLLKTRLAADAVGATPMDRPEDIETNPITGRVYAVMTKNKAITADKLNPANTRPENLWGHIIEFIPPGGPGDDADHGADVFGWDIFVMSGNPADPVARAKFHRETTENGWFVCPDNIAFDPQGRLWVATDGANSFGLPDGIYGIDTSGPSRGLPKLLFTCPFGAEATGPCFTPDGTTLFVSVQHPSEGAASLEDATTLWPDFNPGTPPRPSVVAIRREDGGPIGQ